MSTVNILLHFAAVSSHSIYPTFLREMQVKAASWITDFRTL